MNNRRGRIDEDRRKDRVRKNGSIDVKTGRTTPGSRERPASRSSRLRKREAIAGPFHILEKLSAKYELIQARDGWHFLNIADWAFKRTGRAWNEEHQAAFRKDRKMVEYLSVRDQKTLSTEFTALKQEFNAELKRLQKCG